MRGRTLEQAFVILDEAQNTTPSQMKMLLTRIGERSKIVVTGDVTQIDLPQETQSGLVHARKTLQRVEGIAFAMLTAKDIVRHALVARVLKAYDTKRS
jgi:phosphate starvation-inducible PhoH-like protein